jgi:hypothetical protein
MNCVYTCKTEHAKCVPKKLNFVRTTTHNIKEMIEPIVYAVFGATWTQIQEATKVPFDQFLKDVCDAANVSTEEYNRRVFTIFNYIQENKQPMKTKSLCANLYWKYINFCKKIN